MRVPGAATEDGVTTSDGRHRRPGRCKPAERTAMPTMVPRTMATLTMAILNTAGSSRAISTRSGTKASRSPYGTPSNPTLSNETLIPPTLTPLTPTSLLPGLGGALATAARHAALTRVVVLHALWLDGGAVLALARPPAQLGSIGERYYSSVGWAPAPPPPPPPVRGAADLRVAPC